MLLGDRVGVMAGGRLLEVGSPRELYQNPRFLATFLAFGRANLLPERETFLAFRYEEVDSRAPSAPGCWKGVRCGGRSSAASPSPKGRPGCASRPTPGRS